MIFYFLNRIILGDLVFTLSAWLLTLLSAWLAGRARWPAWGRRAYCLALSLALALLVHIALDRLQLVWVTPLGDPLKIDRHTGAAY